MISVCIPVYNFNICKLVDRLSLQGVRLGIPFEIIVIDDFSESEYRTVNKGVGKNHTYIELDSNIGRSRIRNLFPGYSKYEYLLFVDCDSEIPSEHFLENYVSELQNSDFQVICGGRSYEKKLPAAELRLRWKYGTSRESHNAAVREREPYRYFMSNNFIISCKMLKQIRFDERISGYGYEDTLFAWNLLKSGIRIKHTDNPVIHLYTENNTEFIRKTENGIVNLSRIVLLTGYDKEFINNIKLLRVYYRIRRLYLALLLRVLFNPLRQTLRFSLRHQPVCLWLFDVYKLGLFSTVASK